MEGEFEDMFPGCELGAMPPFGNLYDMQVFVVEESKVGRCGCAYEEAASR